MAAVVALILVPAQGRGSACLDGAHDPQMIAGQSMGFSVSRAMLTENIRHFRAARCSHALSGLRNLFGGTIQGRRNLCQIQAADMQIDGGRCRGSVTKKQLDMVETGSCFNQVGCEAVSQRMNAGRFLMPPLILISAGSCRRYDKRNCMEITENQQALTETPC
jgi:hypothetical protein